MAEKKYIEREALLSAAKGYDWIAGLKTVLKRIPAADVRPVVLCRDCKYSYDSVGGWCCSHGICVDCIVREDFFCADGEKREES
jgi:hypothetical protein